MFKDTEIVLTAPVRTAIGSFNGSLKGVPAADLGASVVKEILRRTGLPASKIESAVFGNVIQAGNGMNPARQASINGGLPVSSPALTVNRVCGSGAQAIVTAAQEVALGTSAAVIAGGMENMDRAPYLFLDGRWGSRMGHAQVIDSMLRDGLNDAFSNEHSGWHTEDLVKKYGISREAQDHWAARSQQRFSNAQANGRFKKEIVPLEITLGKRRVEFSVDEQPRPDSTFEILSKLRPAFRPDGTITAGNAPGLNSGASGMLVSTRTFAERNNLQPVAKLVAFAVSAVEPGIFGIAPAPAVELVLERANWRVSDVDRVEINEAFAAVPLAVMKKIGLPEEIVNVEGGAIAHGHAIGATGAVLTTRLVHSLVRDGLKRGIVTLCIGGGQGIALAIETL
ncbi:thiolase family protein [Paraburkholderia phenoliruptrix]|uniref:thiolase family protein n=1 Tax=Paraburkholderia phenoliruptrix TaxID=252970 RepID=UPI001C4F897F|nr:thiolase family protein [Paraburkholderia phenoliruptrix]MBW0450949.1 thiolase family protein [Paraburkholderia phenoliruptrix]MBW9096546.1 thiolase family protein [Paraburkholderia phenoliruptrix]